MAIPNVAEFNVQFNLSNPIRALAAAFERYITIHGVDGCRTYAYKARNFQGAVVRHTRHRPKCMAGESWLYVALPSHVSPATLSDGDKLYVGSQTSDRMFRGDCEHENFHHAQMRCARKVEGKLVDGEVMGLIAHLRSADGEVVIHRASKEALLRVIRALPNARWLDRLSHNKHFAKCVESLVLHLERPGTVWKWNKHGADEKCARDLEQAYLAEQLLAPQSAPST